MGSGWPISCRVIIPLQHANSATQSPGLTYSRVEGGLWAIASPEKPCFCFRSLRFQRLVLLNGIRGSPVDGSYIRTARVSNHSSVLSKRMNCTHLDEVLRFYKLVAVLLKQLERRAYPVLPVAALLQLVDVDDGRAEALKVEAPHGCGVHLDKADGP